jgi:hypothetical protein
VRAPSHFVWCARQIVDSANAGAGGKNLCAKACRGDACRYPELIGVELATTPPGKTTCVTTNETKGIGEKCDKDEFTAMKTDKPFVEKEKENGRKFTT